MDEFADGELVVPSDGGESGDVLPGDRVTDVVHGGEAPERVPSDKPSCVQKLLDPRLPTQAEVDEHNLTHLP